MPECEQIIISNKEDMCKINQLDADNITSLHIYSRKLATDLSFIKNLTNLKRLSLCGQFLNYNCISAMTLDTLIIRLDKFEYSDLEEMMTDKLKHIEIADMRKLEDLSFIQKAINLEKVYLQSLSAVKVLPDFGKIYSLKIYEMHKLENIDSLINSKIKYLCLTLIADKISGTKIADTLLKMSELEKVDFNFIDRSCRRTDVIENRLSKYNRQDLIAEKEFMYYDNWIKL